MFPYNEDKQRLWLVDPTLFFPSPTPPPKVEVGWVVSGSGVAVPYNEGKQRLWLVDLTLFFPSPTSYCRKRLVLKSLTAASDRILLPQVMDHPFCRLQVVLSSQQLCPALLVVTLGTCDRVSTWLFADEIGNFCTLKLRVYWKNTFFWQNPTKNAGIITMFQDWGLIHN